MHANTFILYLSAFVGLLEELSLDKVCHNYICLIFCCQASLRPFCGFLFFLLMYGGAGSDQFEFLHVENWRELSDGTADGPLDGTFPVREGGGMVRDSKGTWVDLVDLYILGMLKHSDPYETLALVFLKVGTYC